MSPSALIISEASSARIFPPSHPTLSTAPNHAVTVNLSILDASVGLYSPSSATWLYSFPHSRAQNRNEALTESLITTLALYPQWAGQLHLTDYSPTGDHTTRYGRMAITYGVRSDPGVSIHLATSPRTVNSLIPDDEAKGAAGCWNAAPSALEGLLPGRAAGDPGRLALWDMKESDGLPCVVVQLTTFACGGVAIAVRVAHVLADADALVKFVGNWAVIHRGEGAKDADLPVFEPSVLDRNAAGRINRQRPDEDLVAKSRALPVSRLDFWQSGVDIPPALKSLPAERLSWGKGEIMPWETWVQDIPVDQYIVYFNAKEIKSMWDEATSSAAPGAWVSRFDALLAHVWVLLIRARQLPAQTPNLMHVTLGVRARTSSPPISSTFLGSPLILTRVAGAADSGMGQLAASIRANLTQFTPEAVAAYLHDRAFDVSAQRLWSGFLGSENSIMTSWLDTGANQVDFFGKTAELGFVDCSMPALDGIIQFIEAVDGETKRRKWYDGDVAVTMFLRRDVMGRFLGDPLLRKYRDS